MQLPYPRSSDFLIVRGIVHVLRDEDELWVQVVTEGAMLVAMLGYGMLRPRVEDGEETRASGGVKLIDFLDELVRKRRCGYRACDRFLIVATARREDFALENARQQGEWRRGPSLTKIPLTSS